MGLFGKDKMGKDKKMDHDSAEREAEDYATNEAANKSVVNESELEQISLSENEKTLIDVQQETTKSDVDYGIQDAIELMRQLPNVDTDIVISVVIKTLESANIQVSEIILDAKDREMRIEGRRGALIKNIEQLEMKISGLSEEITGLSADFEETEKVKELLVASLEKEKSRLSMKKGVTGDSKNLENEEAVMTKEATPTAQIVFADNIDLVNDGALEAQFANKKADIMQDRP